MSASARTFGVPATSRNLARQVCTRSPCWSRTGLVDSSVTAYDQMAFLADQGSRPEEARLWRERLLETSIATGDVELEILSRAEGPEVAFAVALENGLIGLAGSIQQEVAGAPLWQRRYEAADRSLRVGLAFHSDHGLELYRHYVLSWLALVRARTGPLGRGRRTGPTRSSARRAPRSHPRITALTTVGLVRARRGDPDPWSPLDEAYELAIPSGEPRRMRSPSAARAEAAWLEGRDSEIAEVTDVAYALAAARRDGGIIGALGVWRHRAGLPVEGSVDGVDPHHALEIQGDYAAAAASRAATGCPYEAALALAATDDEEAQREAFDELQRLGASAAAARLRRTGVRGLQLAAAPHDAREPVELDHARGRGAAAPHRGPAQLRDRRPSRPLRADGAPPRGAILRKLEAGSRNREQHRARTLDIV